MLPSRLQKSFCNVFHAVWLAHAAESDPISLKDKDFIGRYVVLCRLQTLVNYALKAERELWGLLDGPWDCADHAAHRRAWSSQASPTALYIQTQSHACLCSQGLFHAELVSREVGDLSLCGCSGRLFAQHTH